MGFRGIILGLWISIARLTSRNVIPGSTPMNYGPSSSDKIIGNYST